jgi:hypothetical protein
MEKYDTWRRIGSYSINLQLIKDLEDFINTKIPRILYSGREVPNFSVHNTLSLYGSKESRLYKPIGAYREQLFANDIQGLQFELLYKDEGGSATSRAVAMLLRLGKSSGDSDLSIALQDHNAKEKTRVIEEGLLNVMEPHKNINGVVYPNEFIPTLVFVAGFLIGLGGLMLTNVLMKSLCTMLFAVAIYFVARRFIKGYCSFESVLQKKLDLVLKGITALLLLFILVSLILIFRS